MRLKIQKTHKVSERFKQLANIITSCRIISAILLIFTTPFSLEFYLCYLIGGLSDMVDGTIARKTNSVSKTGSKLDSTADLIFAAVCLVKILPAINIPLWLRIWIIIIALIKIINMISSYKIMGKIMFLHTKANKLTGFLLFLIPFVLYYIDISYCSVPVCLVATFAAIQEGHFIRSKNYKND